ncbi:MAG: membrane lipoprotein lipid attachment site-containing protein [Glycocaulis sp.]
MRRIAIILTAVLVLSGCQGVRDRLGNQRPNPGPCPNALSLYDAHRLVEFRGDEQVLSNVGFTGEILNVSGLCTYTDRSATPIDMQMAIRFAFGRGPAADASEKTYYYFIAVTRTDDAVIERQVFPVTVRFPADQNRVELVQEIGTITIPRATPTTSGSNFEVIVGFELTPEQVEFNRSGLRFRVPVE